MAVLTQYDVFPDTMNDPERIYVGGKIMITVIMSQTVNYNSFKFTALVHLPIVIICSYA